MVVLKFLDVFPEMGIFSELWINICRQFLPDATTLASEIGLHLFKKLIGLEDFEFT